MKDEIIYGHLKLVYRQRCFRHICQTALRCCAFKVSVLNGQG